MSSAAATSTSTKKEQPHWSQPQPQSESEIYVNNSLTSSKVPFCTQKPGLVTWYACGPTVYDSAHLGHARAYVTFDIIRRILQEFFGYDVFYVMNITDIDDKIILRARRNFLFSSYAASPSLTLDQIKSDTLAAFAAEEERHQAKVTKLQLLVEQADARHRREEMVEQVNMENKKYEKLTQQKAAFEMLLHSSGEKPEILAAARDVLSSYLDTQQGSTVDDQAIFREHAARFEAEFMEDMRALNVREPDVLTRVSEYVDEIISFVQAIIAKGHAYASNGSVYFDVNSFATKPGCAYAKLSPWSVGNEALMSEGEGALASGGSGEKRSANDFALWKLSKPGEPSWASPWGQGRPGWHIECSAMASDLLGETFDMHSGGEDLKFPHHDNELAQSEARFGCAQWVNYFMHAGHLHIEGMKMSKSLKNFITIREALEMYSSRQIRILFLLQGWDKPMNFSPQSLDVAVAKEARLKEFFMSVSVCVRRGLSGSQVWRAADKALHEALLSTQVQVRSALKDNFDYPMAMTHLFDLLSEANKYMAGDMQQTQPLLLKKISAYFTRMLAVFGVDSFQGDSMGSGESREEVLAPVLDCVTQFRDRVRTVAREAGLKDLLAVCDEIRDVSLPDLGVRVEDKLESSVWKLDDPEVMRKERFEKLREAEMKALVKLESRLKAKRSDLQRLQKALVEPMALFAEEEAEKGGKKYAEFDADFIPTKLMDGSEVSAKAAKKLRKTMDKHLAARSKAVAQIETQPDLLKDLAAEVDEITAKIAHLRVEAGFE